MRLYTDCNFKRDKHSTREQCALNKLNKKLIVTRIVIRVFRRIHEARKTISANVYSPSEQSLQHPTRLETPEIRVA